MNVSRRDFNKLLLGTLVSSGAKFYANDIVIPKKLNALESRFNILRMSLEELRKSKIVLNINYDGNWRTIEGPRLLTVAQLKTGFDFIFDRIRIEKECRCNGFFLVNDPNIFFVSFDNIVHFLKGDMLVCSYKITLRD